MSRARELGKSIGSTLASNALSLAISVVFLAYFGRVLPKSEMAVFAFVGTLSSWIILISGLGLATLACRECPGLIVQGRRSAANGLIVSAVVWRTAIGFVVAIFLFFLSPFLCWELFESHEYLFQFRLAIFNALIASIYTTLSLMQWAMQRFHVRAICDLVNSTGGRLLAFGGYLLLGFNGFLLGFALGACIATGVQLWSLRGELNVRPLPFKEALLRGKAYTGADMLKNLLLNLDQPLIGFMMGDVALANFFMAKRLYMVMVTALQAVTAPVGAKISEARLAGADQLRSYFQTSFSVVLLVFIPAGLAVVVLSGGVIRLLIGEAYASSAPILSLYGITLVFQSIYGMWHEGVLRLLPGRFMISQNAVISVVTYAMYLVLLPLIGAWGIPIAAAAGWFAATVVASHLLRRRVGLTCSGKVYTRPAMCGVLVALVIWSVSQAGDSALVFVAMLLGGAIAYSAALFLLAPFGVRVFMRRIVARITGPRGLPV